jgi:hypothetical protein
MPLQPQNVAISLRQGVDTKTDPKQVIPGRLLVLENGRLITRGKVRKRNGYTALGNTTEAGAAVTQGAGIATFKNELLEFTGSELYSYSTSTGKLTDKGGAVSLELTSQPVVRNAYVQTTPDCAYHPAGLKLFTWEDSRGGSRYSVIDASTGQAIVQDAVILSTAVRPKPFALGNYFLILFFDSATNHLRYSSISVASPSTLGSAIDLGININSSNSVFGASLLGSNLWVAYNNTDVGGGISVKYINSLLTVSSALDVTGETALVCLNIAPDTVKNQLWVSYYNGTAVRAFVHDINIPGTTILSPTTIETVSNVRNICGVASNGSATLYYEVSAAQSYNYLIRSNTCTSAGSVGTASVFLRSVGLASKAFSYGGNIYFAVAFQSTLQPTYFVVNQVGKVVAKIAPGTGGGLTSKSILPEVCSVSSGQFLFAFLEKDSLDVVSGAIYTQTGVAGCTLNFTSQNTFIHAEQGNNLHLSGGILSMYDGQSLVEHGFHLYPENVTGTASTSGGNIAAGIYQYYVTYEWTDNQGQIHRSAPGLVTFSGATNVTTTGSTSSVTLTIPTLRLSAKHSRSPVWVVVYRTDTNGTILYRVSSITNPTLNDATVDTVSFTDTVQTVTGNDLLYTNGGVVENIAAPAASFVTTYKNRVIVLPSEDKYSWWPSKEVVSGAPVEFSDLFAKRVNPKGGELTCAIEMDDKIILFTRRIPFYVTGDGPVATGQGDDFSEAQLITTAQTGCSNPKSLVLMPDGIMRQTDKGIYLLDRSLTDHYVGAGVEAYNSATVTSATLVPGTTEVRFTLSTGVTLVYDYGAKDEFGFGQWSVDTNQSAVDACVFNNLFTYLQSGGTAMQETPGVFTDNGAFIKLRVVTSWLSFAGLMGFQRVRRFGVFGDYVSPHKLLVQIAYDNNPVFIQSDYIDSASLNANGTYGNSSLYGADAVYGGVFPDERFQVHLARQKCSSIQISVEDVQSSNFGEGFSLSALVFQVGLKQGLQKIAAGRMAG